MSMQMFSLTVHGDTAKARAPSWLRAAGGHVLAALKVAGTHLYRAMEESNRRKAQQMINRHPGLLDDMSRHGNGRG